MCVCVCVCVCVRERETGGISLNIDIKIFSSIERPLLCVCALWTFFTDCCACHVGIVTKTAINAVSLFATVAGAVALLVVSRRCGTSAVTCTVTVFRLWCVRERERERECVCIWSPMHMILISEFICVC